MLNRFFIVPLEKDLLGDNSGIALKKYLDRLYSYLGDVDRLLKKAKSLEKHKEFEAQRAAIVCSIAVLNRAWDDIHGRDVGEK